MQQYYFFLYDSIFVCSCVTHLFLLLRLSRCRLIVLFYVGSDDDSFCMPRCVCLRLFGESPCMRAAQVPTVEAWDGTLRINSDHTLRAL